MPDKPHAWFALPGHAVVALEGRDAIGFSHAQFMSDVKSLAPGNWQWSGWLTPKGRVIALFALLVRDDESVWLVLPDADPAALADALRRYVFRSKVAIEVRADLAVSGSFGRSVDGGAFLDMSAEGGTRTLRTGERAPEDSDAIARWTEFDLRHGLSRLPSSQTGRWTPHQLSLDRLGAYSVKKGCYPGQEIVARTHFLGKAKRELVLLEGNGLLAAGTEVRTGDQPAGILVSTVGCLGLAVMPEAMADQPLSAGMIVVKNQPILGGLAR